jgi:prepilin-type N-terminal cleavage/methylation domain-containing protein
VTRGFTLIEVVTVLLILALAAGVVAPSVGRSLDGLKLRAEVAGVASFLRAARERAITRDIPFQVEIDVEARSLTLRPAPAERAAPLERPLTVKQLSGSIRIAAEPPSARTIRFLPHGFSSGGRLLIEAPGPVVYEVAVDPIIGRVTTRRGPS